MKPAISTEGKASVTFLMQDDGPCTTINILALQGILAMLCEEHLQGQDPANPSGTSRPRDLRYIHMCLAIYSQMTLDRVFDDVPLAIRMFLVQKVCASLLPCFTQS